jgi:multidrug resistance protein, MATE family
VDEPIKLLPGQALSSSGRPRLDYIAVASLAFPFMVNSAVQAVLNATDTWFIGRVSPAATAAIGAVYWPVLVFGLLFGGVGLAVQTLVAQAYGGHRYARASHATWTALWASLFTVPAFVLLALLGAKIFAPFGLPPQIGRLALTYWFPRMLGGPLGVALWAVLGFFNGIGRPTVTLRIAAGVAVINALLNQLFMFNLDMGVAGSAWATNVAQLIGVATALAWFLAPATRARFRSHLTTRLDGRALWRQLQLGFPMGLLIAADILGFALFQLMQVRLGTVDGASTQIVMMLTSFCYMPAVGIAMAGTTLVGQAIGAHRKDWALKVGNGIILIAVLYMGAIGVLLAALGPWVLPFFTNAADPQAAQVVVRGSTLLWIAAGYQLFDGLNISSSANLRGAGDVRLPAVMVLALSWLVFVPLAHSLSFAPGQGWVDWLPQYGLGAVGGCSRH